MSRPYFHIQPAFTGGEVSGDVASRVDLDKYQLAVLQAENVVVRPYGSLKKRAGFAYKGTTKGNGKAVLKRFEFATELSYLLEFGAGYLRVWRDGVYLGVELSTPFAAGDLYNLRTAQSVDVMYICTGTHPVYKLSRYAEKDWRLTQLEWTLPPFGEINDDEDVKVTPSGTDGTISISANADIFSAKSVGDYMKIEQQVTGLSANLDATNTTATTPGNTNSVRCGDNWKIITHGTWAGTVWLEISDDGGETWRTLRTYTGNNDYNPSESGEVDEVSLLRAKAQITSGTCKISLSTYPYKNEGYLKIMSCTDARNVSAKVLEPLGSTSATADFYFAAWSQKNGYPYTVTFFQDRLCFGGCSKYPQRVWLSCTGDYENFKVEKEGGTVTDDSAVTADLLSLKSYQIKHLMAANDLIVITEGNTWTISGSETVTPSNISPRNQENYGANHVEPMKVGARTVYVQRRGSTVRDVGYSYDSDSYTGGDLTLLAKHLVRDVTLIDGAYAQEPDSLLYFVTSAGRLLVLTYVPEQKVYAWSHFVTDGAFEAVCTISDTSGDRLFAIVRRVVKGVVKRYIEELDIDHHTDNAQDYHMLDSYVTKTFGTATKTITGLDHLNGKQVFVLADGYFYDSVPITVTDGKIMLPENVKKATIGIPYTMTIEQTNFEVGNTELGTLQGRKKLVTTAILRLENSYGGKLGADSTAFNKIIYYPDKIDLGKHKLYSGDMEVVLGKGGYNVKGRTYLVQAEPFPFDVSAIIREVTLA